MHLHTSIHYKQFKRSYCTSQYQVFNGSTLDIILATFSDQKHFTVRNVLGIVMSNIFFATQIFSLPFHSK